MYKKHEYVMGSDIDCDSSTVEPTSMWICPETINIGAGCYVGHGVKMYGYPHNKLSISIGNGVWIGSDCFIHGAGGVVVESDVGIGPGVKIVSTEHEVHGHQKIMNNPLKKDAVLIKKYADIGMNALIKCGVTVGEGAQVAMGAVVTRNIPNYEIWGGIPARKIGERKINATEKEERKRQHQGINGDIQKEGKDRKYEASQ